jgi:hypothetical protein
VEPQNAGTETYTYEVTNGEKGIASCSVDITVNDVVVTGSVTISSKDVATSVACRKSIIVSVTTDRDNQTYLHCTGAFNKEVGSSGVVGQYNEVVVYVCDGHGHGNSPQACAGTFTTECLPGKTMSCTVKSP